MLEQSTHTLHVTRVQGTYELFDRRPGERFDLVFHRRPAVEAVAASHHQLRVRKPERIHLWWLRVKAADALERRWISRPGRAQQLLRALLLHFEIRSGGKRFDEKSAILFGRHDDTSR
jgi:hypothetical protein